MIDTSLSKIPKWLRRFHTVRYKIQCALSIVSIIVLRLFLFFLFYRYNYSSHIVPFAELWTRRFPHLNRHLLGQTDCRVIMCPTVIARKLFKLIISRVTIWFLQLSKNSYKTIFFFLLWETYPTHEAMKVKCKEKNERIFEISIHIRILDVRLVHIPRLRFLFLPVNCNFLFEPTLSLLLSIIKKNISILGFDDDFSSSARRRM